MAVKLTVRSAVESSQSLQTGFTTAFEEDLECVWQTAERLEGWLALPDNALARRQPAWAHLSGLPRRNSEEETSDETLSLSFSPALAKKKKSALNVFLGWQHLKCNWNIISSLSFTWNLLWVSAGEVEGKWMIGFSSPPNQRSSACQICQAVHLPRVPASLSQAQKENQEPQRYFLFSHPIFFFPFTHHLSFFHISFLSEFIFFRLVPQSSRFFLCVSKSISPS